MMSTKAIICIIVILLAIIAAGYYGYSQLIEAGYPPCASSIEELIRREFERGAIKGVVASDEWQALGENEEQAIFAEFRSKGMDFDCSQFERFADGSALIGNKGYIRFRKEGSNFRVRIESDEDHEIPY